MKVLSALHALGLLVFDGSNLIRWRPRLKYRDREGVISGMNSIRPIASSKAAVVMGSSKSKDSTRFPDSVWRPENELLPWALLKQ